VLTVVWETSLVNPDLVRNITVFYVSQAKLLLQLMQQAEEVYNKQKRLGLG
jgi:hypothetical protein